MPKRVEISEDVLLIKASAAHRAALEIRYNRDRHRNQSSIAPLAQLDRASGYEPEGREFESLRARHCFVVLPENSQPSLLGFWELVFSNPEIRIASRQSKNPADVVMRMSRFTPASVQSPALPGRARG